jgi:hypothetical protein
MLMNHEESVSEPYVVNETRFKKKSGAYYGAINEQYEYKLFTRFAAYSYILASVLGVIFWAILLFGFSPLIF